MTPNPAVDRTHQLSQVRLGAVHRSSTLIAVPGGKGYNVARVARLLGATVRVGAVLAGHAGRWMQQAGLAEGLGPGVFAWVDSPAETRTCLIVVEAEPAPGQLAGPATVFNEVGPSVPPDTVAELRRRVRESLAEEPADWLSVSGSLPTGTAPSDWVGLIGDARSAGARVAVDATGAWLAAAVAAEPDLLRINGDEAAGLLGGRIDTVAAAAAATGELRARGARAAVVSLGSAGAVAADALGTWHIAVPAVPIVSPIGGGDTMLAGVLDSLTVGADLAEAARRGAALATAKCLRLGSSRVELADWQRLLPATTVSRLA